MHYNKTNASIAERQEAKVEYVLSDGYKLRNTATRNSISYVQIKGGE